MSLQRHTDTDKKEINITHTRIYHSVQRDDLHLRQNLMNLLAELLRSPVDRDEALLSSSCPVLLQSIPWPRILTVTW